MSVLALLFSTILIGTFSLYQSQRLDAQYEHIDFRIKIANSYLSNLDDYVQRQLTLTTREALKDILEEMDSRDLHISNASASIESCLVNGNFTIGVYKGICENTIEVVLDIFESYAKDKHNINLTASLSNVSISESGTPWHIKGEYSYNYYVNDSYAIWNVSGNSSFFVPIFGLREPLNMLSSHTSFNDKNATITPIVNQRFWSVTGNSIVLNGIPLDIDKVVRKNYVGNVSYFDYNEGPSFLNRLENNTNSSGSSGFATLIHFKTLSDSPVNSDSLDYNYFLNYNISEMAGIDYFKIDFGEINTDERGELNVTVAQGIDGAILDESTINRIGMNVTKDYITPLSD